MRSKLLIGLATAGLFLAGFGGAVLPASAAPHHFLLTLADSAGTVPWTGEPGDVPTSVTVGGVPVPVVGVQDLGEVVTETTPPPTTTEPPTTTPPATTTEPERTTPREPGPTTTTDPAPSQGETQQRPAPSATPQAQSPAAAPAPGPGNTTSQQSAPAAGTKQKAAKRPGARRRSSSRRKTRRPRAKDEGREKADDRRRKPQKKGKERQDRSAEEPTARPQPATTTPPAPTNPTFSLAEPGAAPVGVPNFFIDKFRIPPFLLPIYQAAGVEYGVRWEILAAINEIETDYGRNLNVSSAGAVGWMQFMPATWEMYGTDANHDGRRDPYNPVDAIFSAARYLKAAGAEQDIKRAVFAYNHADWYVDSVLMRARLIGGLPADLVGSLTGLTQGHFPVHAEARYAAEISPKARRIVRKGNVALPVESRPRSGINIYAKAGSPVIAVQDGKIVRVGKSKRLGKFIQLRDVYGNTYTYARLKSVADVHPVPRPRSVTAAQVDKELNLPKRDPKPTAPASAGRQPPAAQASAGEPDGTRGRARPKVSKERLFANPYRPEAYKNGGEDQLFHSGAAIPGFSTFKSFFTEIYGLKRDDVVLRKLKVGSKVIAGTILGRIGKTDRTAPHTLFEIRPAGRNAPRVDPKPILDGWKLLESTAIYRAAGKNPFFGPDAKNPSIGQILMLSKEALQQRVLRNPSIDLYECGRRDIRAGAIERRVLATLEFLAASGLKPAVSSLTCGHSRLTASGNVSHHSTGTAVDIAAINGIPIMGHQGAGSITDITIRRLLTLQGAMKPAQIISLMTFEGADNTLAMADHHDHIHIGWQPLYGSNPKLGSQLSTVLQPGQWVKLMDRLSEIDNPTVRTKPSKYSLKVKRRARGGSAAHRGD